VIDFFHKGAEMTKKITGVAKLKGVPEIHPRPPVRISRIGTIMDEEDEVTSVLLEVADTPEKRRQGLMGRGKLPSICGMMFDGLSGGGYFWMKNCIAPLDIMFLGKNGYITKTYSMPVDKDGEKHYEYDDGDTSAIEVSDGFLKRYRIKPGMRVEVRDLSGKEGING